MKNNYILTQLNSKGILKYNTLMDVPINKRTQIVGFYCKYPRVYKDQELQLKIKKLVSMLGSLKLFLF